MEATLVPTPPYSLADSARARGDGTRIFRDGVLTLVYEAGGQPALARVRQRRDATLAVQVEARDPAAALDRLRFVLALDADHSEFLRRFRRDPLLAAAIRARPGLRPLRTASVAHALLKAVCGQLIQARAANLLERRLTRFSTAPHAGLHLPPSGAQLARFAPAELVRRGLAPRKAATLVRVTRELDLERLHDVRTDAAASRIERERGLGPWSAGVVCLYGLGRYEQGLVGDLGLVKLCASLRGRWTDADDTRELLEPYGEWAGLASVYLLAGLATREAVTPASGPRAA